MMMAPCFLIHILIMVFNSGFELVYCSWDSVGVSEEGEDNVYVSTNSNSEDKGECATNSNASENIEAKEITTATKSNLDLP